MKHQLTTEQIESYRSSGFLVIENFLSGDELEHWRKTVTTAVKERGGIKIPGKEIKVGEADGINEDADYLILTLNFFFEMRYFFHRIGSV